MLDSLNHIRIWQVSHPSNINIEIQQLMCVWVMLKNKENNGKEEIDWTHRGMVTLVYASGLDRHCMMMSSNIFRVTGRLCGEFTGDRWIPRKGQWGGTLMFSLIYAWINGRVKNGEAYDLRCHRAHYDVNVMGSRKDLSPDRCQAITWINAHTVSLVPWGCNSHEPLIKIPKRHLHGIFSHDSYQPANHFIFKMGSG